MIMSDMRNFVLRSSKREISEKRVELLRDIDGEIFYPLSMWPKKMERLFWKKPLQDKDSFKLVLFLFGNGCPATVIADWIVSSTFWKKNKTV